eukprot:gene4522-820_t
MPTQVAAPQIDVVEPGGFPQAGSDHPAEAAPMVDEPAKQAPTATPDLSSTEKWLDVSTRDLGTQFNDGLTAFLHSLANDPSVGFYRVQEHITKAVPSIVQATKELKGCNAEIKGGLTDINFTIEDIKDMTIRMVAPKEQLADHEDQTREQGAQDQEGIAREESVSSAAGQAGTPIEMMRGTKLCLQGVKATLQSYEASLSADPQKQALEKLLDGTAANSQTKDEDQPACVGCTPDTLPTGAVDSATPAVSDPPAAYPDSEQEVPADVSSPLPELKAFTSTPRLAEPEAGMDDGVTVPDEIPACSAEPSTAAPGLAEDDDGPDVTVVTDLSGVRDQGGDGDGDGDGDEPAPALEPDGAQPTDHQAQTAAGAKKKKKKKK